jgi:hypothetical protein
MRIVDHTPAVIPVPAKRAPRSYARVERIAAIPALPRHQSSSADRGQYTQTRPRGRTLPPRGWLFDFYV